jgi:hypothetical protein
MALTQAYNPLHVFEVIGDLRYYSSPSECYRRSTKIARTRELKEGVRNSKGHY